MRWRALHPRDPRAVLLELEGPVEHENLSPLEEVGSSSHTHCKPWGGVAGLAVHQENDALVLGFALLGASFQQSSGLRVGLG